MIYSILKLPLVESRTGISRSEIYRLMHKNKFPKTISLGKRSVGWVESEINDWIQDRIKDSRNGGKS